MLDKTDQKHNMHERSSEIHVWSNTCREVYAQTFVQVLQRGTRTSAGVFPYQEMPSEIRAVTDANRAGNWRDCARRRVDGFTLVIICWRRIRRRKQIVALSTAESEYISITKGAAHALEVRSAMVEFGLTFNVVCETDASAWTGNGHETWCRPRASLGCAIVVAAAAVRRRRASSSSQAWRAQRSRPGNKDVRFEANDLAVERNTLSTAKVGAHGWWRRLFPRLQRQQKIAVYQSGT